MTSERECLKTGKRRFSSRVAARRGLRTVPGSGACIIYFCNYCFSYHFGHRKPKPS